MRRKYLTLLTVLFLFALDRASKIYILSHFSQGNSLVVWPGVLNITRVDNAGAAFGLFRGFGLLLVFLSVACILFLTNFILKRIGTCRFVQLLPPMLVIAGALGNLYDRVFYGYVIDFIDFRVWPVFNVADISISVGIFFIIVSVIRENKSGA